MHIFLLGDKCYKAAKGIGSGRENDILYLWAGSFLLVRKCVSRYLDETGEKPRRYLGYEHSEKEGQQGKCHMSCFVNLFLKCG